MKTTQTKDIDELIDWLLHEPAYTPEDMKVKIKALLATQKEQLLDRLDEAIGEDEIDLTELDGYTITVDVATQLRAVLTKERKK